MSEPLERNQNNQIRDDDRKGIMIDIMIADWNLGPVIANRAKLTSNLGQPISVDVRQDGMAEQQQNNLYRGPTSIFTTKESVAPVVFLTQKPLAKPL